MDPTKSWRKPALSETWVVNSSPIITLAKAGFLQLLDQLAPTLLVPEAVVSEILAGPPSDPARRVLESGWGHRVSPREIPGQIIEWGLGSGESAVLALSSEDSSRVAVVDDAAARKCARALNVPVIGTLAVVLQAKQANLIPSASRVLIALRNAGLRLDDKTLREALGRGAGEIWPPV
jgi:predicted nucleic acid-binding protein